MMIRARRYLFLVIAFFLTGEVASGQVVTGTPPYSSISGGPVDSVNLANLNVHFRFPVLHKAGRGLPFNMDATYDTTVLYPAFSSGGLYWQIIPTAGWTTSGPDIGTFYYDTQLANGVIYYCDFVYYDGSGTGHPFPGPADPYGYPCPANSTTTSATTVAAVDGSGYTVTVSNCSTGGCQAQLNSRDGN